MALVLSAMKYQMKNDVNEKILMYVNSAFQKHKTQQNSIIIHNTMNSFSESKFWVLRKRLDTVSVADCPKPWLHLTNLRLVYYTSGCKVCLNQQFCALCVNSTARRFHVLHSLREINRITIKSGIEKGLIIFLYLHFNAKNARISFNHKEFLFSGGSNEKQQAYLKGCCNSHRSNFFLLHPLLPPGEVGKYSAGIRVTCNTQFLGLKNIPLCTHSSKRNKKIKQRQQMYSQY